MKQIDLRISEQLDQEIRDIAAEHGIAPHDVLRRGLAVLKAFRAARARGICHIGFTAEPAKLDVEVTNVL